MSHRKPPQILKTEAMIRAVYRGNQDYTFVRASYEPGGYFGWQQPAFQLVILRQGRVTITIDGETIRLQAGEGILMHPGWQVFYLFDAAPRSLHTGCQVASPTFKKEELQLLKTTRGIHRVPSAVHILIDEGLASPLTAGRQLQAALLVMAKACLLRFAADVAETTGAGLPPHPALSRALEHLEADPTKYSTANELARHCGISVSRLRQIFREAGRESPSAMIWRIKTAHAVQMIRSTGLTLGEIADRSGFTNPFHLSRSVKKQSGLSPRQIRDHEHGVSTTGRPV